MADMEDVGRRDVLEDEDEDDLVGDVEEEEVIEEDRVADEEMVEDGFVVEASVDGTEDTDEMEEMVPGKGKGMVVAPLDTGLLVAAVSTLGIGIVKKMDPVAVSCAGKETDICEMPADACDACTESIDASLELIT